MKPEVWITIVAFIGLGLIIAALVYWSRRMRAHHEDRSGGFLTLSERSRVSLQEDGPDDKPKLDTKGASPELLSRMEAAGMNTTHERWEDWRVSKRKGPRQVIEERRREATQEGLTPGLMGIGALGSIANAHIHSQSGDGSPSDSGSSGGQSDGGSDSNGGGGE